MIRNLEMEPPKKKRTRRSHPKHVSENVGSQSSSDEDDQISCAQQWTMENLSVPDSNNSFSTVEITEDLVGYLTRNDIVDIIGAQASVNSKRKVEVLEDASDSDSDSSSGGDETDEEEAVYEATPSSFIKRTRIIFTDRNESDISTKIYSKRKKETPK